MREIELAPIKETTDEYEKIEKRIIEVFREHVFMPLVRELGQNLRIANATTFSALLRALEAGRVTFDGGAFHGRFSATISKDLVQLGATWDKASSTYRIDSTELPHDLRMAIKASNVTFEKRVQTIAAQLQKIVPEEIAGRIQTAKLFDSALDKTDRRVRRTLKDISVPPELTPERRRRIADEWQNNLELWIKNFTAEEIQNLRKMVLTSTFKGNRYESLIQKIEDSYGVTKNKAKFLARQETSLLMSKFKEARYTEAGILEYRWGCVVGSAKHPVRPAHKRLEGKVFRWDDPPITTEPDQPARRNNPGEDYNCRCFAKPVVRFGGKK